MKQRKYQEGRRRTNRSASSVVGVGVGLLGLLASPGLFASSLPADSWKLSQQASVVQEEGVGVLRFESGRAVREDLSLEDGTIELEMKLTDHRAFSYIQFRLDEEGNGYEEIYFRNHKNRAPDALQYSPVDNGMSAWQLFHGTGKTAAVELPPDRWIDVKLELKGSQAAVFVGETGPGAVPDLVISRLARPVRAGGIALRGFIPRGSEAEYSALYRNVRYSKNEVGYDFSAVEAEGSPQPGQIEAWRLSESFAPEAMTVTSLLDVPEGSRTSRMARSVDPEGLLNIGRELERPQGARSWATVAAVTLEAAAAGRHRLDLGYSDAVSVFLNGELLFSADDSYSFDLPRRQGLIGLFQASVYLPLRSGENELQLVVADRFGGWGLMGSLQSDGVVVKP